MTEYSKNNIKKVYCTRCDSIFDSREKFEKHFDKHSSTIYSEVCPIDTAISKLTGLFKRKSTRNLE